jgi:methyl-accepting chemotaxis protein
VQKLNADEAVRTHREWKGRLRLAMAQREILDIETVSSDKHCAFGEWLCSEQSNCRFQDVDFARCVALHAAFHLEAAGLASLINAGHYLEADRMPALGSSYSEASQAFIISVRTLFASAPSQ